MNNETKKEKSKKLRGIIYMLISTLGIIGLSLYIFWGKVTWEIVFSAGAVVAFVGYVILMKFNKEIFYKMISVTVHFIFISIVIIAILKACGVIEYFNSVEKIRNIVQRAGAWGIIVFILIQVVQVIISPIPGMVTITVGAQIYGPLLGFVYSSIGIIVGSIAAFLIGRFFSETVAKKLISSDELNKYRKLLNKKGRFLLPLVFLLPLFPDDIICIVAGITTMTFRYFLITTIITRPIGVLISSYFMSGTIIPFYGWGIGVWVLIAAIVIALFVVIYKYEEQIERFFMKATKKFWFKNKAKCTKRTKNNKK